LYLERDLPTWDQIEENLVLSLEMVLEKEGSSLSPVIPIFYSFGSIFVTLFQIQEPLGPVQKRSPVPSTYYVLPNARGYVSTKFYEQLK